MTMHTPSLQTAHIEELTDLVEEAVLMEREFQTKDPEDSKRALERVKQAAMNNENVFAELMHAVRYCSLGEITQAMFEVGGQYRRTM